MDTLLIMFTGVGLTSVLGKRFVAGAFLALTSLIYFGLLGFVSLRLFF